MDDATRQAHVEKVRADGYSIVEDAIEPDLVEALNEALARLEHELGAKPAMNGFEGRQTVRIYNLLAHGEPFQRVPVHASVLPDGRRRRARPRVSDFFTVLDRHRPW